MKQSIKLVTIAGLILAVGVVLAACKKQAPATQTQTGGQSPAVQSEQAVEASSVEIANFAFSPATLTVKAGQTITVTNRDTAGHTMTSDDGTSFDSGNIAKDQSKTITAPTKPGSYPFHCTPHPNMKGTLIVQ